jgi:hypothetical protein
MQGTSQLNYLKLEDVQVDPSAKYLGFINIGDCGQTVVSEWAGWADHTQYYHCTHWPEPGSPPIIHMNELNFAHETPLYC